MMQLLAAVSDLSNQAMAKSVEPAGTLTTGSIVLLCLAIGMALAFEFVNGFHDTANAVATVIYTHSLKPWVAVVWSGCWNLIGVLRSTGGVAFGVLALLPAQMLISTGSSGSFAMVFAILLSAIVWNLGTWYLGLPASSSHTLFGAIIGVGIANAVLSGHSYVDGVNWTQLERTLLWLLLSPVIGFLCAGLLLLVSKALLKWPELFKAPEGKLPPPLPIRALLVLTCTGVSYGHGSNDGQKGMGLMLLILIGVLPGTYALSSAAKPADLNAAYSQALQLRTILSTRSDAALPAPDKPADVLLAYLQATGAYNPQVLPSLNAINNRLADTLNGREELSKLSTQQRSDLRQDIFETTSVLSKLKEKKIISAEKDPALIKLMADDDKRRSKGYLSQMNVLTQHIPDWVMFATAGALGLGTMIGWKRIVVTVGEKIGKTHLTYAQGAAAELVAASTIIFADHYNKPVSTTHVLSSGVAGTMAANGSGLQMATLRNLLIAWVLTLPVCTLLGAGLFAAGLLVVIHQLVYVTIGVVTIGALLIGGYFVRRYRQKELQEAVIQSPVST